MYEATTATIQYNYWITPIPLRKAITAEQIINAGCMFFKVNKQRVLSKIKEEDLVRCRYVCMYIIAQKLNLKPKVIGEYFNRDRTTVLHALQCVENDLSLAHTRQQMREDLRGVINLI